ncbi:hypothetical protein EDEG_01514 [Edhazardia aedis USNM 41457]|uniref:J domain-containing protein n=1 Tax=Edhazardia aedis (strain USNM 41457) TaxID=1003232 RepID=J9D8W2_EDHAE|nr:hypothetical protein EDEG_01514 [Edhazardia aedis USNM 41457]|eukprot:EJW04196.1 hypothetical protein EDEG_01514 [Edhazardia aedis USNM 41457]
MHQYSYDETGLPSSYLALTFTIPLTLYTLYISIKKKEKNCQCKSCINTRTNSEERFFSNKLYYISKDTIKSEQSNRNILRKVTCKVISKKNILLQYIFFVFLLCLNIMLAYKIKTTKVSSSSTTFDPYKILNVDENCSKKDLKRAFRKIVKKNDPDSAKTEEEREKRTEMMYAVTKAYNLLQDGTKLHKFNTEIKDSQVIYALPEILVCYYFLFFYFGVFVLFVFLAFKYWIREVGLNLHKICFDSVGVLYDSLRADKTDFKKNFVEDLLCETKEFKNVEWKVNSWVVKAIQNSVNANSNENTDDCIDHIKKADSNKNQDLELGLENKINNIDNSNTNTNTTKSNTNITTNTTTKSNTNY